VCCIQRGSPIYVAIYTRVSPDQQTTKNQLRELKAWAKRAGHQVVQVYDDKGVSGAKGREYREEFDAMLKAVVRARVRDGRRLVGRPARP
jgi:DNA invertase Pin-like site-specific DNA recombinase